MIVTAPEIANDRIPETSHETSRSLFAQLMDLTLGWGEQVEQTEGEFGDTLTSADIYTLYQSVAEFADPYWDATIHGQEQAVREFVETRIIPVLLGKPVK